MDGIDAFLDGECSLLSESDAFSGENRRMIRMIAVVRAKCLEMTFVGWLRHCREEEVRVYMVSALLQMQWRYSSRDCVLEL